MPKLVLSGIKLLAPASEALDQSDRSNVEPRPMRVDQSAEVLAPQHKFSLQTAWLVVKVLPRGYLLRLACSGRTRLWLEYGENIKTKHNLDQQIFEGNKWVRACILFQIPEIEYYQIVSSHAQMRPQGAEKHLSNVWVGSWVLCC